MSVSTPRDRDSDKVARVANAVRELFVAEHGELRLGDWIEVGRSLGMVTCSSVSTPKPEAAKNLEEIVGINLEHALESYDWGSLRPATEDGITVARILEGGAAPEGYLRHETGRYFARRRA